MILIVGATGQVGGAAARTLIGRSVPLRVLTRDPARTAELAAAGAEVAVGDLDRPETLAPAFRGVERVLLSTTPGPALVAQQLAGMAAARAAGVKHVVRVSTIGAGAGADVNMLDWHGQLDDALQASGMGWTLLQPHSFSQNYLIQGASITGDGRMYGAMGEGRIPPVDVADIGAVAAAVLTEPGHEGRTYPITGPESLTSAGVAAAIGRGIGRDVQYVDIPSEALEQGLRQQGLPDWLVDGLVGFQRRYATGEGDIVTDVVQRIGRVTPTTVESFARQAFGLRSSAAT